MLSYEKEMFARQRIRERHREAARERLARPAGPRAITNRTTRTGFALALIRRLARVAAAS
jgi:hypothetical protein